MASELLLDGIESVEGSRWPLADRDEEILRPVLRMLMPFAAQPGVAAVVHARGGEVIAGWNRDGALRLAHALPPAYEDLARALREHHELVPGDAERVPLG